MYALDDLNVVNENIVLEIGICLERIELLFVEIGFNGLFTRVLRSAIMNGVDYWINPLSQSIPSPFRSRRSCCIGRSSANFIFLTNYGGDIVCTDDKGGASWLQTRLKRRKRDRPKNVWINAIAGIVRRKNRYVMSSTEQKRKQNATKWTGWQ